MLDNFDEQVTARQFLEKNVFPSLEDSINKVYFIFLTYLLAAY
jgi:hypothetical protein